MPAAIVTAAVTAYSAYSQKRAADKAANAQKQAAQQGADAFNQARQDLQPYAQFGQQAMSGLNALNNGDLSGFTSSPDYQFALQSGINNLDKSAASRGSLFSGGHEKDLSQFNQGLASQYLGNYRNSLLNQLSIGQNAAAGQGSYAGGLASVYGNQGQASANAALSKGETNSQLAGVLGNTFGDWYAGRTASSYAPTQTYSGLGGTGFLNQPNSNSPFNPGYAADFNSSIFARRS